MSWEAFASAAGNLAGSFLNQSFAKRNAAEAHDWSNEDAQTNRNWEERMSNTAHQREVKDLRAAGLNPVLSGTGGSGASTPSGSMPTVSKADTPNFSNIVASALEARNMSAQNQLLKAQAQQSNSASSVNDSTKRKLDKETDILGPKATLFKTIQQGMQWGAKKLGDGLDSMSNSNKPNNKRIQPSPRLNNKY